MKRILIVTLYGNNNFGNKLQNYALQETLKKMSFKVETAKIKYRGDNHLLNIKIIIYNILRGFILSNSKKKKEKEFVKFNKEFINYNDRYIFTNSNKNIDSKYDYVVYGSDQVWNPSCYGNSNLFLGFLAENNISYSASFGINNLPKEYYSFYRNGLKRFKSISVREESAANIIDSIIGLKPSVVVDPTLLLSKDEWKKIERVPKKFKEKKYILNYFLGDLNDERYKIISEFAKKNNCSIINIMDEKSDYYNCGPSEFLYLEENAYLICTDSFHSCVFALIFNTPFVVFERDDNKIEKMGTRIDNLLKMFDLSKNKYSGFINYDELIFNEKNISSILKVEKQKAFKYLEESLHIDGGDINE